MAKAPEENGGDTRIDPNAGRFKDEPKKDEPTKPATIARQPALPHKSAPARSVTEPVLLTKKLVEGAATRVSRGAKGPSRNAAELEAIASLSELKTAPLQQSAHTPSDVDAWSELDETVGWEDLSDSNKEPGAQDAKPMVKPLRARLVPAQNAIAFSEQWLTGEKVKVGRTDDCDIRLLHASISRHHAMIEQRAGGELWVRDLGSGNGTFVNGEQVRAKKLQAGDEVRFGQLTFHFRPDGDAAPAPEAPEAAPRRSRYWTATALLLLVSAVVSGVSAWWYQSGHRGASDAALARSYRDLAALAIGQRRWSDAVQNLEVYGQLLGRSATGTDAVRARQWQEDTQALDEARLQWASGESARALELLAQLELPWTRTRGESLRLAIEREREGVLLELEAALILADMELADAAAHKVRRSKGWDARTRGLLARHAAMPKAQPSLLTALRAAPAQTMEGVALRILKDGNSEEAARVLAAQPSSPLHGFLGLLRVRRAQADATAVGEPSTHLVLRKHLLWLSALLGTDTSWYQESKDAVARATCALAGEHAAAGEVRDAYDLYLSALLVVPGFEMAGRAKQALEDRAQQQLATALLRNQTKPEEARAYLWQVLDWLPRGHPLWEQADRILQGIGTGG